MWHEYYNVESVEEAVRLLSEKGARARIVAGATDMILELERGTRRGVDCLIDITRVDALDQIQLDEKNIIHLGPLVTHNAAAASTLLRERAYPLARAAWEVGAPQIRNRATIAGNLITASPANDTITPLIALNASVTLISTRGEHTVALKDFYSGVRKTIMQADEFLSDISFPALTDSQRGTFMRLTLRRAQAISLVNIAVVLTLEAGSVRTASITLGAVAPTIIHAPEAESFLIGKSLTDEVIAQAAQLTMNAARPIDDIRASAAYRKEMVRVLASRALTHLRNGTQKNDFLNPVLLWGKESTPQNQVVGAGFPEAEIQTSINDREYRFSSGHEKTLLRLLREEGLLIGTKEGCAEGECGACTIFLDGKAVMSCLVPAPRAHGAQIVTVEGLASPLQNSGEGSHLHAVQSAFIEHGAVQCGYCTPGFIMSAAKLLEENPRPSRADIEQAITGNLCRCTGYYKIVDAIQSASQNL